MAKKPFTPFVPASESMAELTVKAVLLGVAMAVVLGAANAYLGMKAGLTDRKSTRLNSSHSQQSRMPSSA